MTRSETRSPRKARWKVKPNPKIGIIYMQILKEERLLRASEPYSTGFPLWQAAENLIGDSFLPIWRFSSRPIRPSVLHCRYCHDCYNAKLTWSTTQNGALPFDLEYYSHSDSTYKSSTYNHLFLFLIMTFNCVDHWYRI